MKKFLVKYYPLLIILTAAETLRINLLFARGTFWFDEEYSVHFSILSSWADTVKYWILETNPPLFSFLMRPYLNLFGQDSELIARLPSLFFALASIILLYILAEKIFSRKAAFFSALFLSLSAIHIILSVEARVYSLLLFLTISSCFLFYKIIFEKKDARILWPFYTVINLLLIYSHLTALVVILAQLLAINLFSDNKRIKMKWFISQTIAGALWLPWFLPSIWSKLNLTSAGGWFFNTPGGPGSNLIALLVLPFINSVKNNFITTIFFIIFMVGFYLLVKMIKQAEIERKNLLLFLCLWAFLPIFFSSLLGIFVPKYLIISYPALYLLAGGILDKYMENKKKFIIALVGVLLILLPSSIQTAGSVVFSWQPFNQYIQKNETEHSLVFMPFSEVISFGRYYRGRSPLIGLYTRQDKMVLEERIARYNWNRQDITKKELENWLSSRIDGRETNRIFIIQLYEEYDMFDNVLFEQGWKLNHKEKAPGYFDYYLFEFKH